MGIRKKDLSEFIERTSGIRKKVLRDAAYAIISAKVEPVVIAKYPEMVGLERDAAKLFADLEAVREKHKRIRDAFDISNAIRQLNTYVVGFTKTLIRSQSNLIASNLLNSATNGYMTELDLIVAELKTELTDTITKYTNLTKITEELIILITSCRNGDAAYKRLQELGVDLTGFEVVTPNLPAVIKLSADVCVLNGDCK